MIVTKIIIQAGQLDSRQALHARDMNPQPLRAAQDTLAALREGVPSVSNPVPGGPEMTVALGLPPDEYVKRWLREIWQEHHPNADPSEYEAIRRQVDEHHRRTGSYIAYRGATEGYTLVPLDCSEEDAGLYGTVAGSCPTDLTFWEQASEQEQEMHCQEHYAVAREIVALKPAFIAPSQRTAPRSLFGDHFAVAMLLSTT